MSRVVVLETLRRHYANLLGASCVIFVAILGLGSSRFEASMWPTFITLVALGAGAGLIGPEFSSGTLQLILVKPINRAVYLVSRVTGVVLFVASAAAIAFVCEAGGRLLWGDRAGIEPAAIMLLNLTCEALLICSLLAMLGTFMRAYFNIAAYWVIQVVVSVTIGFVALMRNMRGGFGGAVGDFLVRHPIFNEALVWITRNLFADPPRRFDPYFVLTIACNSAIAIVLACFIFRRREVPYGAD